jgi:hypothetical protein
VTGSGRFNRQEFINQIMMGSDTTIAVLSGISYELGDGGSGVRGFAALSNEDLIDGVMKLDQQFPGRMLSHAMVMPNDRLQVQLDMMERVAGTYTNWKTYPPWSPSANDGYWLDGDEGVAMIEKGIELGSPIFCIHKGFPLNTFSPTYTDPQDVGRVARMFEGTTARFVIYHSAFEHGLAAGATSMPATQMVYECDGSAQEFFGEAPEGYYDESLEGVEPAATPTSEQPFPLNRGVNALIKSLRDNNIGPNGSELDPDTKEVIPGTEDTHHVYAECGGVWPNLMLQRPEEGMHYWGKLLKYLGERRIVWGTDCLWFGSPQPVIEAFRCFQISSEFQEMYGYPELTWDIKARILGLNAANLQAEVGFEHKGDCHADYLSAAALRQKRELDEEFGRRRDMIANVSGPATRRDFLKLQRSEHREKIEKSGNIAPMPRRSRVG